MSKGILAFGLCFLLICSAFIPISLGFNVRVSTIEQPSISFNRGKTLYVGGSGPDNYTRIQDAINDADDGDTVFVYDDSSPYYGTLEIGKSINLIGEDRNSTVIEGDEWISVIIYADWVNFSDFTIFESSADIGLFIDSCSNINLTGNKVMNGYTGILLSENSSGNMIMNNIILGNTFGIQLTNSNYNKINGNEFFSNDGEGLIIQSSHNNNISENIFQDNQHDLILGFSCSNNIIIENIFLETHCHCCIGCSKSENISFIGNKMKPNWGAGIDLTDSNNSIIIGNAFFNSKVGGIYITNSFNNIVYHNNFINNRPQSAYDECINIWDNDYPSGGNYWDDYNGTDSDSDGIGDTPYSIPGDDNKDRYPLMEPWNNVPPNSPIVDGPKKGKTGINYDFTFVTTDLDGDDIWYYICWGDKEIIYIYGPYPSGKTIILSYNWSNKGNYVIQCKAMDEYFLESNWTEFEIKISNPRTKVWLRFFDMFPILQRILNLII